MFRGGVLDSSALFDILAYQGRTLAWVAGQLGVTLNYLSQIKGGRRPMPSALVPRLCRVLGVPPSLFEGGDDE